MSRYPTESMRRINKRIWGIADDEKRKEVREKLEDANNANSEIRKAEIVYRDRIKKLEELLTEMGV